MAQKEYTVARHHIGDKDYAPRDKRVADEHDVAHLVAKGVLIENKADVALDRKAVEDAAAAAALLDKAEAERLAAAQAASAEAQQVADAAAKATAEETAAAEAAKKAKA